MWLYARANIPCSELILAYFRKKIGTDNERMELVLWSREDEREREVCGMNKIRVYIWLERWNLPDISSFLYVDLSRLLRDFALHFFLVSNSGTLCEIFETSGLLFVIFIDVWPQVRKLCKGYENVLERMSPRGDARRTRQHVDERLSRFYSFENAGYARMCLSPSEAAEGIHPILIPFWKIKKKKET